MPVRKLFFFVGMLLLLATCTPFSEQILRDVNIKEQFEVIHQDHD